LRRVIAATTVDVAPRVLGSPAPAADPVVRRLIDQAADEAYARGAREAAAQARQAAAESSQRLLAALEPVLRDLADQLRGLRADRAHADAELALAIATAVLGHEPAPDARELATGIRAALAHLDEAEVVVRVNPADAPGLQELLAGDADVVSVLPDPAVENGTARVTGSFGRADVGRDAALAAVRLAVEEITRG
jgi:flagellar biosynthesis/type III secretory pathway protein FliH